MNQHLRITLQATLTGLVSLTQIGFAARAIGPERIFRDAAGNPLPIQSDYQIEEFLRTARITQQREIVTAKANLTELLIEKGNLKSRAAFLYSFDWGRSRARACRRPSTIGPTTGRIWLHTN